MERLAHVFNQFVETFAVGWVEVEAGSSLDAGLCDDISKIAQRLVELTYEIDGRTRHLDLVLSVLLPHKERLSNMLVRVQKLQDVFLAVDVEASIDNLETARKRKQQVENGIEAINTRTQDLESILQAFVRERQNLMERLSELLHFQLLSDTDINHGEEAITDAMVSVETLETFERDCDEFDAFMQDDEEPERCSPCNFDDRSERSERYIQVRDWELEIRNNMIRFSALKRRRIEVQELPVSIETQKEFEQITRELLILGEDLCAQGIPVIEGSFVDIPAPNTDDFYAEFQQGQNQEDDRPDAPAPETEAVHDVYEGPGLFDNVNIEKPNQQSFDGDGNKEADEEKWLTPEEVHELMEKVRKAVISWLETFDKTCSPDIAPPDTVLDNGLNELPDVELAGAWGDVWNVKFENENDALVYRSRLEAWAARSTRAFDALPEDTTSPFAVDQAKLAHPRDQRYIERDWLMEE